MDGSETPIVQRASRSDEESSLQAGRDPDKPAYHVQPRNGWLNDGNGFIYYKGRYHMFYQHVPGSSEWAWRMCWGHCSSADLINWVHEPIALRPTPGGLDEKGCWSGCCAIDQAGIPVILYTGVRMGAGPNQLKAEEDAVSQPVVESQCAATCLPDDDRLIHWTKVDGAVIPRAPPCLAVTGFRDPYVIQTGGNGRDWLLLIGSGIDGEGGALLLYRSQQLSSGPWEYVGPLCIGKQRPLDLFDTGAMWECPFFQQLPPDEQSSKSNPTSSGPADAGGDYVMCVSPYPHVRQATTNPCLYWIGKFTDLQFDLENSHGPFLLDLGNSLYAPNCFRDGSGRLLMVGWLQEGPSRGTSPFDYSGCLSLPRVLTLRGGRLHQAPAPELAGLEDTQNGWLSSGTLEVTSEAAFPVPSVGGAALSVDITIDTAASAATAFSVLLLSEVPEGREGAGGVQAGSSTAITVDWAEATLKVHRLHAGQVDTPELLFDPVASTSPVGGGILVDSSAALRMHLFLDHSVLEVFLNTGDALATRIYGRVPPAAASGAAGVSLLAHGGNASVVSGHAVQLKSIWQKR